MTTFIFLLPNILDETPPQSIRSKNSFSAFPYRRTLNKKKKGVEAKPTREKYRTLNRQKILGVPKSLFWKMYQELLCVFT